jgi:hypothetical protein
MRMMRFITALGTSCIILILASLIIPSCQATIEEEFEEFHSYWFDREIFTLKAKIIIETEKDGTCRVDTPYKIYLLITLTYVDHEIVDYVNITEVTFPSLVKVEYGQHDHNLPAILSDAGTTWVFFYVVKFLKYEYEEYRFDLNPQINFDAIVKEPAISFAEQWDFKEPVFIDVTTTDFQTEVIRHMDSLEAQLNTIRNILYVFILTTIILIAITTYFAIKKTKV